MSEKLDKLRASLEKERERRISPFQTVLLRLVWRVLESVPSTITTTTESN